MAKRKPKTRAELEAERLAMRAQDLAAVNLPPEVAALPAGDDIEVTRAGRRREGQRVTADSARRLDAFLALKESMLGPTFAGCFDAARRLEKDIRTRRREGDRLSLSERVDGSAEAELWFVKVVQAGRTVDAIRTMLPDRDYWLLTELIVPSIERPTWRDTVANITGEANANAQGAAVRAACVNLRDAYVKLDAVGRKAA